VILEQMGFHAVYNQRLLFFRENFISQNVFENSF